MSNRTTGQYLYAAGDAETKAWFAKQWAIWPERADPKLTTNISLHYGGVLGYRIEHGRDPEMSDDFRSHVEWHDQHPIEETPMQTNQPDPLVVEARDREAAGALVEALKAAVRKDMDGMWPLNADDVEDCLRIITDAIIPLIRTTDAARIKALEGFLSVAVPQMEAAFANPDALKNSEIAMNAFAGTLEAGRTLLAHAAIAAMQPTDTGEG